MRRFCAAILCLLIVLSVAGPVMAATGISGGNIEAIVSANGSCQVTLDLTMHMEAGTSDLVFPIPSTARNVMLNGNSASTAGGTDVRNVKLSSVLGNVAGDFTIRIQYTLPSIVAYDEEDVLVLTLPLLSGFNHPIERLSFAITLPGEITGRPLFSSGYYHQTIESSIVYTKSGNSIHGTINSRLKDRETLTMFLTVPEEMFPQTPARQLGIGVVEILMAVVAGFAVIYWIIFLRSAPIIGRRSAAAPEGYTGGELAGLLNGRGYDLTMMVFSWAQLGYILIHLQQNGKVTLYKRMDMGNERDPNEARLFNALFGKRDRVDASSLQYAKLCRKVAATPGSVRDMYKRSSGNPKGFRILCAGIGLLGGISLGYAIVGDALLGILLIAILAIFGGVSSWLMQAWAWGLHLRNKPAMIIGLSLAALWILLGAFAGVLNVTACVAGAQLLCGVATVYGGRRTILGRQILSEALGFRRYLKKLSGKDVQRICRVDPDYFFSMAPYALALGVIKPFAKSFGKRKLSGCSYLTTGKSGHMTAQDWCQIMERAADALDARQRMLLLERLTRK
jgi:hypothetical protein